MRYLLPILLLAASPALALNLSGYRVAALPDGKSFQVAARVGDTGPDYFCGAALYAKRVLKARGGHHLVVVQPEAKRGGDRVVAFQLFRELPPTAGPSPLSVSARKVGEHKTVTAARTLCRKPAVRAFGVTKSRGFPFAHF